MTPFILAITASCLLLHLSLAQPPSPNQNQTTPRPSPQMFGRQQNGVVQQQQPMVAQPAQNQGGNNMEGSNNASAAQMVQFQQGGNGCPPLFGQNFPSQQQTLQATGRNQCQWVIISDRNGCPMFFQNCGSNPPMCNQQNEIWWQCTSQCEPSCGNPRPNCRQSCGRSGCQCFPGFLRNQNGFCVPSNQCPSFEECQNDNDCEGSSMICRNGQCQQGCTSNNACRQDEQCSNGRCVERRNCERSSQCRNPKICFANQCRTIGSIFCRFHSDCPGSSFCNRNGRCQFPFRNSDNEVKAENTENGFFF